MLVNDSFDIRDVINFYRDNNIGVEKFLELNFEDNFDEVCLFYIFIYRDFVDGVFGLVWVGEKGNRNLYVI